ncbi:MAG: TolC family protein [Acidobacteria bacterium]|nr:TolC family protein [Acidobacteriota bacterium]MCB9396307.1 TolC family protein [Acidobacteriota bacterium]
MKYLFIVLWVPGVFGQTKLTLEQLLEWYQPMLQNHIENQMIVAEMERNLARVWENPNLTFTSEKVSRSPFDERESYWILSQTIAHPNVLAGNKEIGRSRQETLIWRGKIQTQELKANLVRLFFNALTAQKETQVTTHWVSEMNSLSEVIGYREDAGQVSGFDRRKWALERVRAQTDLAKVKAQFEAYQTQLAQLMGLEMPVFLEGETLPENPPLLSAEQMPAIKEKQALVQEAIGFEKKTKTWGIEKVELELGHKSVDQGGFTDSGSFLGLRIPLPVWNHGRSALTKAKAERALIKQELEWTTKNQTAKNLALRAQTISMIQAAREFRAKLDEVDALVSIGKLAYREGEMDILSLLNTLETERDLWLQYLSLCQETRSLWIELHVLGGAL